MSLAKLSWYDKKGTHAMQSCNETFNIEFSVSITNHISESAHHLWKLLIHPAAQSRTIEATPTVTSFIDKYSVT